MGWHQPVGAGQLARTGLLGLDSWRHTHNARQDMPQQSSPPDHHKEMEGSLERGSVGRGSILTAAAPSMTVAVVANGPPYATRPAPTSACCVTEGGDREAESALEEADVVLLSWLMPTCSLAAVMPLTSCLVRHNT